MIFTILLSRSAALRGAAPCAMRCLTRFGSASAWMRR
jgi:hypothetical protein